MAPRLSPSAVAAIENALREPDASHTVASFRALAEDYNTSLVTIYHHYRRVREGTQVQRSTGGPWRVITWTMERAVMGVLDIRP